MDIDDLEPRKRPAKARDLSTWSVEDLESHIGALEAEIARARAAIASKQAQRSAADSFFRKR